MDETARIEIAEIGRSYDIPDRAIEGFVSEIEGACERRTIESSMRAEEEWGKTTTAKRFLITQ